MAWHLAYSSFAIPNANAPVYWRWENFSLERITGNEAFAKEMSVRFTSSSRLGSSQYSHRRPITEGVSNQRNVKRNAMGSALWFTDAHPKLISHALPVSHHPQLQAACTCFMQANMQHRFPFACGGPRYCWKHFRILEADADLKHQETDGQTRSRAAKSKHTGELVSWRLLRQNGNTCLHYVKPPLESKVVGL